MKRFQLSSWIVMTPIQFVTPAAPSVRNTFRDVAVTYEDEAILGVPLIKRLVDIQLSAAMINPGNRPDLNAYDLMVINFLLPDCSGTVVMTVRQQRMLKNYLREQTYTLLSVKRSPLADVSSDRFFSALYAVLHVVENYTSILPLWKSQK